MTTSLKRASALFFAGMLALAGCSGTAGDAGAQGPKGDQGDPGADYVPATTNGPGLKIQVTGATVNASQSVSVTYTVKDDAGTAMAGITPRFAIAQVAKDATGRVLPYVVLTKSGTKSQDPALPAPDPATVTVNPTAATPSATAAATTGVLVDNGSGSYTYTFPAGGMTSAPGTGSNVGKTTYTVAPAVQVAPTSTSTYTIWIQASRQEDLNDRRTITPLNVEYDFVPAGGTPERREIASTAGCNKCHNGFKKYVVENGFHGGGRIEAPFCGICHNIERSSGRDESLIPAADAGRFVHRLHFGEHLARKITTGTLTSGAYQFRDGAFQSCTTTSACTCTVALPCSPTVFHGIGEVTYPQDFRNCKACHEGASQGSQWNTRPNRSACGSCHDYVNFVSVDAAVKLCKDASDVEKASGCRHSADIGPLTDDSTCSGCHTATKVQGYHVPVRPPDPANSLSLATIVDPGVAVTTGTQPGNTTQGGKSCSATSSCNCTVTAPCAPSTANTNTNAAYIAAAGAVPVGASVITYEMPATGAISLNTDGNPVITFKIKKDGVDVAFDAASYNAGTFDAELMGTAFVGSPSVYAVWALPQDGITSPADFNGSASAYLRNLWNGTATTTFKINGVDTTVPVGTISQTPSGGYYTVTLTSVKLPTSGSVKLLTGGVGYSYSLTSTQPLTQIDLPNYPFNQTTRVGGLIVPAANVWKAASSAGTRRAIVASDRCNACHANLGVAPTFHAGQRNDGPTCSFCHNPNRASSGWSANASTFIHGIHGTDKRGVPFNWHSACPTGSTYDAVDGTCKNAGVAVTPAPWYPEVTYPGYLANCQTCHLPGTYDFSATTSAAAVPNLLWSTVATGSLSAGISLSPYVAAGTSYGSGYSISNNALFSTSGTTLITEAAGTTLVTSPIMAACVSCHDTDAARGHMQGQGGSFYKVRSAAKEASGKLAPEGCLLCHGPGKEWSVTDAHR